MGTQIKNLSAEEAQRRLAAQLQPRDDAPGVRGIDQDYEAVTAKLKRLEREVRIGHDARSGS